MKSLYCAARINQEGKWNFYRKTPAMILKAAEVSNTHMPKYGFTGKSPDDAEVFPTKEKLYQFMRSRPETERVFPYIVTQVVDS